jgi:hypothetical protein
MDFQNFKNQLEQRLTVPFELLEFNYSPYLFGSGFLAYRINGHNFKFVYDGRDNNLNIYRSNHHEKYTESTWLGVFEQRGLDVDNFLNLLLG